MDIIKKLAQELEAGEQYVKAAVELIDEIQPDIVIVSYSRLMFEDHTYNFGLE